MAKTLKNYEFGLYDFVLLHQNHKSTCQTDLVCRIYLLELIKEENGVLMWSPLFRKIGAGRYCECRVFTVGASSERSVFGRVGRFYFQVKRINVASQGRLLPSTYIGEYPAFAPPAG